MSCGYQKIRINGKDVHLHHSTNKSTDRVQKIAKQKIFLQDILKGHLDMAIAKFALVKGKYGKPFLDKSINDKDIRFNLTHSRDLVLIAVTNSVEIGVDLEVIRPFRQSIKFAERFFSAEEQECLKRLEGGERDLQFYSFWVEKEAKAKALGIGIVRFLGSRNDSEFYLEKFVYVKGSFRRFFGIATLPIEDIKYIAAVAIIKKRQNYGEDSCCR